MQSYSVSQISPLRLMRQNFARQIRKNHLEKTFKKIRQENFYPQTQIGKIKNMKNYLANQQQPPLSYIEQIIMFLEKNAQNQQIINFVEQEKVIQAILVRIVQNLLSSGSQQNQRLDAEDFDSKQRKSQFFNSTTNHGKNCQCNQCIECATSVSVEFNKFQLNQPMEIDRDSNYQFEKEANKDKTNSPIYQIFNRFLYFLDVLIKIYSLQNAHPEHKNKGIQLNFRKFNLLFLVLPETFQRVILHILKYQQRIFSNNQFEAYFKTIRKSQRIPVAMRIIQFLSRLNYPSWLQKSHWYLFFQIYNESLSSQQLQIQQKSHSNYSEQTYFLFKLLFKSYNLRQTQLFLSSKNLINKPLYNYVLFINQIFQSQLQKFYQQQSTQQSLYQIIQKYLQFYTSLITDFPNIPQNIITQNKTLLNSLINLLQHFQLQQTQFSYKKRSTQQQISIEFFYIDRNIKVKQQSSMEIKIKQIILKLIQNLYENMEIDDQDLNQFIQKIPSMKNDILRIVDQDMY